MSVYSSSFHRSTLPVITGAIAAIFTRPQPVNGYHFKDIGIQLHSQVLSGHPAREILHYAGEEHIDLIVIATHGHSGLASVLLGSVTDKVVHKAPCPVLTVRHSDKKSTSEETAE